MSDIRKCKGRTERTESKDLAPHHHFTTLIRIEISSTTQGQHASGTVKKPLRFREEVFLLFLADLHIDLLLLVHIAGEKS